MPHFNFLEVLIFHKISSDKSDICPRVYQRCCFIIGSTMPLYLNIYSILTSKIIPIYINNNLLLFAFILVPPSFTFCSLFSSTEFLFSFFIVVTQRWGAASSLAWRETATGSNIMTSHATPSTYFCPTESSYMTLLIEVETYCIFIRVASLLLSSTVPRWLRSVNI